jgi:hypothetical protein
MNPLAKAGEQGVEKLSQIETLAIVSPGTTGVWPVHASAAELLIPQTTKFFASVLALVFSVVVPLTAFLEVER